MSSRRALLAFATILFVPTLARAKACEGVTLPDSVAVDSKKLVLNGMGVREATVFNVNVYVAGLYLESPSSDGVRIAASERTKRIQLVFVRDVSRADMSEALETGFKKAAAEEIKKLSSRIERFKSLLPEFQKGDALTLTYRPGTGVEVAAPGKKGTISGSDFSRALFLVWLGSHPPNEALKRGLLGGKCG